MTSRLRVLLVDEHAAFRQALARVLAEEPGITSVAEVGTLAEARELRVQVDVCLTELRLPDGLALELIPELLKARQGLPVVVLTAVTDVQLIARAVEAGAVGVLSKQVPLATVIDALQRAGRGERLTNWQQMNKLIELARADRRSAGQARARMDSLTPRERQVLEALADGLSDKELAASLAISVETVRTHLVNVFGKLQVESRLQAALCVLRQQLAERD